MYNEVIVIWIKFQTSQNKSFNQSSRVGDKNYSAKLLQIGL